MEKGHDASLERLKVGGFARPFSRITLSVDPPAVAPPASDARWVALLRRARDRGVTTFDVAEARFPERAERLVATAFPTPDPEVGAIVGRSVVSLLEERREPRGGATDLSSTIRTSLEHSRRRLAPVMISVVEWVPEPEGGTGDPADTPQLRLTDTEGEGVAWAVRIHRGSVGLPALGYGLFAGELSLLDRRLASLLDERAETSATHLIARNPFRDGRLDGSRFAASSTPNSPGEGPIDMRSLQREFDPVLRLGFLTAGHRRTLAQAALRFVLGQPWVATAVIPLPPPERFDEILGFESTPPLTEGELARLDQMK